MKTEKLYIKKQERESVLRAAEILKGGGTVAIPTETVYGLAADATNPEAIKKIFEAKGRPQDNPLIVHIADIRELYEIASCVPEEALKCAQHYWPGPLTMVLERKGKTAECVSAGLDTVAVRMPNNKNAIDIIRASGLPLAAPSANRSGSPSPTTPTHVEADLFEKIDAIVYGEDCDVGVESTVVSFCCKPARLLRPGAVTLEMLREIIPDIEIDKAVLAEPMKNEKVASPGMKYKHYAPKTEAILVSGSSADFCRLVNDQTNAAAICFSEDASQLKVPFIDYGSCCDEQGLAHSVFSALRDIDAFKVQTVYIHAPSKCGVGLAVYNRLLRASAFRVIEL